MYRGDSWMQEPCKSCDRRTVDFGGCRCQAMALVGDAAATDPVCMKSPHHGALRERAEAHAGNGDSALTYRVGPGKTSIDTVVEPAG